jgi:phosphohistidine phosphatase
MKTLLLLRHAKSSWKDTGLSDFDRPLNDRGRKAAQLIGGVLATIKPVELVVSSPAVRARQTVERVLQSAMLTPEVRFDQRIYEATSVRLLEVVSQFEDEKQCVMLVGHNPGLEDLLGFLTGTPQHMPTAGLAVLSLNFKKWEKIMSGKVTLTDFIKPKNLKTTGNHESASRASKKQVRAGSESG